MSNPYQPPPDATHGDVTEGLSLPRKLNPIQYRWMTWALQTMRFGSWLLLASTLLALVALYGLPSSSSRALHMLIVVIIFATIVVMAGLIAAGWAVPFRPRFLPRVALGATLLGTTLSAFYFSTVLDRGMVGGLFRLFGAASLAMLLIGMACIALFVRKTMASDRSHAWIRVCDFAVIAYATSAACYSACTLYPSLGQMWRVAIPCLAGMIALTLHAFATETAAKWWQRSGSSSSMASTVS